MLQVSALSKQFGKQFLFQDITFSLGRGEKVGFVGRNGSGKSTLFKMLLGEMDVDNGSIHVPKGYTIGTLPQHIHFTKNTVLEEGCSALPLGEEYNSYKIERLLSGLGFSEEDFQKAPSQFSGGFQIRINLAKTLVQNPDLLLLDEPTNYLDIVSQRWLASYLKSYRGEIILITHDREFMDQSTDCIMGLHRNKLRKYPGDTNNYYGKIVEEEEHLEKERLNQESQKKHLENYINRFRASARRASQAQSRVKRLAKFENLEALSQLKNLQFKFNYSECPAKTILNVKDLSFGYDPSQPLINDFSFTLAAKDRVGIIGKNGKGKSTLLNLLGQHLEPSQGEIAYHPSAVKGHFGQTNIKLLDDKKTVEEEIESVNFNLDKTAVRSICGTMLFDQDLALKKVAVLSGGERARVLLGKLLANSSNLLLLDEPTNHLDQESIEGLIEGIDAFPGALVIVTHSEMLLRRLVNKLIVFHRDRVDFIDGNYDYFLDKQGWEEDVQENKQPKLSKQESKKLRAEIVQERSRVLRPLKKQVEKLEEKICVSEAKIEAANAALLKASEEGDAQQIIALSKEIKEEQTNIEINFAYLEKSSSEHDEKEKEFQQKLEEF